MSGFSGYDPYFFGPQFMPGGYGGGDFSQGSPNAFASAGLQYQPMTSLGLSGNLGYGGGLLPDSIAPLGGMLINGMLPSGYTGTNPFGGLPNLGPAMRNRQESMGMMQAVNMAQMNSQSITRARMQSIGANLARFTADPNASPEEIQQQGQHYGDFMNNMVSGPMGMMGLGMLDQMTGMDISGTLQPQGRLAQGVYRAGMGMYRGYGTFGMDPSQAADISVRMANAMYPGGKMDPSVTHGFTAGRMGDIMVELQRNNMMGGLLGADNVDATGLDDVAKTGFGGDKTAALNAVNAKVMTDRLSSASKLFKVAQDITGSDDATQLMQAIQTITGGAAARMSPDAIEGQMNRVQEITRAARVSMDQMMYLINEGSKVMQGAGFTAPVGAAMAISSVEQATIVSARVGQAYGDGAHGAYNLSDREVQSSMFKMNAQIATSFAARQYAGIVGTIDEANLVSGGGLNAAKARLMANPNRTAQENKDLAVLQGAEDMAAGVLKPEDAALFRGDAGLNTASETIARLTGERVGDVRLSITNQGVQSRALTQHTRLGEAAEQDRLIEDKIRMNAGLAGSGLFNGPGDLSKGDSKIRQAMIDRISDLQLNTMEGSDDYTAKRNSLMKDFGLTNEQFNRTYAASESIMTNVLGYAQGADRTTRQGLGASAPDRAAFMKNIAMNSALMSSFNDKGGVLNFGERIVNLLSDANPDKAGALTSLLGGISDKEMVGRMEGGYSQLAALQTQIDRAAPGSEEQKTALAAQAELRRTMMAYLPTYGAANTPESVKQAVDNAAAAAKATAAKIAPKLTAAARLADGGSMSAKDAGLGDAYTVDGKGMFHKVLGFDKAGQAIADDGDGVTDIGAGKILNSDNTTRDVTAADRVAAHTARMSAKDQAEQDKKDAAAASPATAAQAATAIHGESAAQKAVHEKISNVTSHVSSWMQDHLPWQSASSQHVASNLDGTPAGGPKVATVASNGGLNVKGTLAVTLNGSALGTALMEAASNTKPGIPSGSPTANV